MINSKLFTTLLKYKVNNDYNVTCEQLLNKIKNEFESDKFNYMFRIVTAEYTYKTDASKKPYIEIVVMIYATVDPKDMSDKAYRKLFAEFIDDYCAEFDDIDVALVSRDIAA